MRRNRMLVLYVAAALCAAGSSAAIAQDTPQEYANQWTEARRGDRTWSERATEQLTTGVTERVMGRPPTGPMKVAAKYIHEHIEQLLQRTRDPCLAAALDLANYQTIATGRQEVMAGAFGTLTSALEGATGGTSVAEFLGETLFNQVKEKLREQAFEKFKEEMAEAMKRGQPDFWSDSDRRYEGRCRAAYSGVWDKATERYYFLIAGDCQCSRVNCGMNMPGATVLLRRWSVEGWGTIVPRFSQGPDGEKLVTFSVGRPQEVSVTAECCGQGDVRRYSTSPGNGPGNDWVGFVREPQVQPPTPPRRPETGGTPPPTGQTGTTGRPPRQPAGPPPIRIPVIPDGPLTDEQMADLEQRVFDAEERAQSERQAAESRVFELEKNNASEADLAAARAAAEAAAQTHREARAARQRLNEKARQQAQQQDQQQQQQQEQSSLPPDPASAQILAVHNSVRSEVGAPPLRWDARLAANAAAHAAYLARIGQLIHAPRESRGMERENLSQGTLGWSPQQMMANWIREKRNFLAGIYPNVSRTGRWEDVAHYTQMIWPTTTNLGCGLASGSGRQWLVCRYSPGGNKDGRPVLRQRPGQVPERGK